MCYNDAVELSLSRYEAAGEIIGKGLKSVLDKKRVINFLLTVLVLIGVGVITYKKGLWVGIEDLPCLAGRPAKMVELKDRFPLSYDFSRMIDLIQQSRELHASCSKKFVPYFEQQDDQSAACVTLIGLLHHERQTFLNFVWEVKAHSKAALTGRQIRALLYYEEALNRTIEDMERLKKQYSPR